MMLGQARFPMQSWRRTDHKRKELINQTSFKKKEEKIETHQEMKTYKVKENDHITCDRYLYPNYKKSSYYLIRIQLTN